MNWNDIVIVLDSTGIGIINRQGEWLITNGMYENDVWRICQRTGRDFQT
jgi:hypothetical protein